MTTAKQTHIKTVHSADDRDQLAVRIRTLQPDSVRVWGKMSAAQMLVHCERFDRWILSGDANRQSFIGRIIGRAVLKRLLRPNTAMDRNIPTMPALIPPAEVEFGAARDAWLTSLADYAGYSADVFVHDFFGPLSHEEVGAFVWKHADHHLKQFGV